MGETSNYKKSQEVHDDTKVDKAGDTMTGKLTISPTSGTTSLEANKDIVIKAGYSIIYDG